MILADFVPVLEKPPATPLAKDHPILETKNRLAALLDLKGVATHEERDGIFKMHNRLQGKWDDLRFDFLVEHQQLPPALQVEGDLVTAVAATPKTSLAAVREIVDKLGFVVIPFEYLNPESYAKESWEMKDAIQKFNATLGKKMQIYVVCPAPYYSIDNHVASKEDRPLYAGLACAQAFMAVSMAIPMFRSMSANIAQLRNEMRGEFANIKVELQNMSRRLDAMHAQLERQRLAEIQRQKEYQAQIEELRTQRLLAMEPMMLAIPHKVDIASGDSWAVIGPCWGPDFNDIVMASLDIKKVEGQKQKLTQGVRNLLGLSEPSRHAARGWHGNVVPLRQTNTVFDRNY